MDSGHHRTSSSDEGDQPQASLQSANRQVAQWLPHHNTGICQSQTDWVKFLMKRTKRGTPYPASPTPVQLSHLPEISYLSIQNDRTVFTLPSNLESMANDTEPSLPRQKSCWHFYRTLFYHDLNHFGIPSDTLTFDWMQPVTSSWNAIMLAFVVKHWIWAKDHRAFADYAIEPDHVGELKCLGILERWLRGRVKGIKREAKIADYKSVKIRNARHKSLFKYRRTTIERLFGLDALSILPDIRCCSDTEESGDDLQAVGLEWRHPDYEKLQHLLDQLHKKLRKGRLAAQRMDANRRPATRIDYKAKPCENLPLNCYSPKYISKIGQVRAHLLTNQPSSNVLDRLIKEVKNMLDLA